MHHKIRRLIVTKHNPHSEFSRASELDHGEPSSDNNSHSDVLGHSASSDHGSVLNQVLAATAGQNYEVCCHVFVTN